MDERLITSADGDPEVQDAWAAEVELRQAEIESGAVSRPTEGQAARTVQDETLDPDIDSIKRREQAAAQVRAESFRLAQSQRDTLATNFADLLGDGGASDERADEMIQAIREWRDTPSNRSLD